MQENDNYPRLPRNSNEDHNRDFNPLSTYQGISTQEEIPRDLAQYGSHLTANKLPESARNRPLRLKSKNTSSTKKRPSTEETPTRNPLTMFDERLVKLRQQKLTDMNMKGVREVLSSDMGR